MDVSKNKGTPKSSILIGFSLVNHPFWGIPIFGDTHILSLMRFSTIFPHKAHLSDKKCQTSQAFSAGCKCQLLHVAVTKRAAFCRA